MQQIWYSGIKRKLQKNDNNEKNLSKSYDLYLYNFSIIP